MRLRNSIPKPRRRSALIRLNPEPGMLYKAHLELGKSLCMLAQFSAAVDELERAIQLYPEDTDARELLPLARKKASIQASRAGSGKDAATAPEEPLSSGQIDDLVKQAGALLAARDWQGAIPLLEKLLAAKPDSWTFLSGMGDARFNLGQYALALDAYQKGIRAIDAANVSGGDDAAKNNSLAHMLGNEALAFLRLKRNQEAIAAWTREAGIDASPVAHFNLCATEYNTGNFEGALDACDKATVTDPRRADAWFIKGALLIAESKTDQNGKVRAAPGTEEALKKYLELEPNGPHAQDVRDMLQYIGSKAENTDRKPG